MGKIDDLIKENLSENGEVLTLRDKFLGVRGIMQLADNPALATIKKLVLSSNQTCDEGAEALADSPHLGNLEHLNLNHNDIGDDGAIAIANSDRQSFARDIKLICAIGCCWPRKSNCSCCFNSSAIVFDTNATKFCNQIV